MSYPLKFRFHVLGVREREDLTLLATALRFAVGISTLKYEGITGVVMLPKNKGIQR